MGCGHRIISSGAAKSYDRSLCDKSTKFGVVMLYFMHFRMGTIKNYNDKTTIINIFEKPMNQGNLTNVRVLSLHVCNI